MQHDLFGSGYDLDLRSNFQQLLFLKFLPSGGQTVDRRFNLRINTLAKEREKSFRMRFSPAL